MVWAVFHHSAYPKAAPLKLSFDPKLAAKSAPLSRQEDAALAARFTAQDEVHARALAQMDELAAACDAEIARLRAEIKKAQAANQLPDDRDYSEAGQTVRGLPGADDRPAPGHLIHQRV
jgi:type I restriction enzyme R subunit